VTEVLRHSWAETALGRFFVAVGERGLVYVSIRRQASLAEFCVWAGRHAPGAERVSDRDATAPIRAELAAWSQGELREFTTPVDLRGTEFQRECWAELQRIPYGQTITYQELARCVSRTAGASRAVGQANGANPIPIVVPCHRVVATTGLGGFGGGLPLKRRMLELEGALLPLGA
jgi:O-6-methylguanine DNA methyltransferase